MFSWIIFLSTCVFFATSAFAESSKEARASRNIVLIGEPISFTPYPGGGLRAGFILNDLLTFEGAYTSSFSNLGGKSRYIYTQVDGLIRVYLRNSFNISTGVGYRQIAFNFETKGLGDFKFDGVKGRTGALGPRFAIGNRWQINSFTIGCDWVGFFYPMNTIAKETTGDEDLDASQNSKVDSEMDHRTSLFGPSFVRLHLGFAF